MDGQKDGWVGLRVDGRMDKYGSDSASLLG